MRSRTVFELLPVLVFNVLGALLWYGVFGIFTEVGAGTDRQLYEALLIGAGTWFLATFLIVWLWWSGKSSKVTLWIPLAWWLPSCVLASAVVYN
jgi:hypothetical protein